MTLINNFLRISKYLNPFHASSLSLYPLKTPQNLWFSLIFSGYIEKGSSDMKWVKRVNKSIPQVCCHTLITVR